MKITQKIKAILIRRLLVTFGILSFVKFGTLLPVPGLNHIDVKFFIDHNPRKGVMEYFIRARGPVNNENREHLPSVRLMHGDTLFVSKNGNDRNTGGSRAMAYKTISRALKRVVSDSLNPTVISIGPGKFKPSTGEQFPLKLNGHFIMVLPWYSS